jgi:hypothetical protein
MDQQSVDQQSVDQQSVDQQSVDQQSVDQQSVDHYACEAVFTSVVPRGLTGRPLRPDIESVTDGPLAGASVRGHGLPADPQRRHRREQHSGPGCAR